MLSIPPETSPSEHFPSNKKNLMLVCCSCSPFNLFKIFQALQAPMELITPLRGTEIFTYVYEVCKFSHTRKGSAYLSCLCVCMCPGGFQSYHTQIIKINQPIKIPLPYKSMQKNVPEATQH